MNPVNGGIPASDNIDIINMILFIILPLNELYILLIDFELDDLITRNTGTTIIEYMMKYEMHDMILLILNIDIIHPMWPIDE